MSDQNRTDKVEEVSIDDLDEATGGVTFPWPQPRPPGTPPVTPPRPPGYRPPPFGRPPVVRCQGTLPADLIEIVEAMDRPQIQA